MKEVCQEERWASEPERASEGTAGRMRAGGGLGGRGEEEVDMALGRSQVAEGT